MENKIVMIKEEIIEDALRKCYESCRKKNPIIDEKIMRKYHLYVPKSCDTFRVGEYAYGEIFKHLMVYALYKHIFKTELFSLENYLDELLKVGSTFSDCGLSHVVLCRYKRKKTKISCTFVDYKHEPYFFDLDLDFSDDSFEEAAYKLGSCKFHRKTNDIISEKDVIDIITRSNKLILKSKKIIKTMSLIHKNKYE